MSNSPSSSSAISIGDYAPSPNTCSQALTKANQLRIQALLRQLLLVENNDNNNNNNIRLDTLRVLRKTIRELNYQFSWLIQVDFLETIERILREENELLETDWRLINDCTQLLIESIPKIPFDLDYQTINQIFPIIIQNLGHQRSEIRRSSLLLINMFINERAKHFQQILKLFIDYGLNNYLNKQAQKGSILSLPLLMTEQVVYGQDLFPLIKCLTDLLIDDDDDNNCVNNLKNNSKLFYSLYLALQRLHLTIGNDLFQMYLNDCNKEAKILYEQAASRNNSIVENENLLRGPIIQQNNSMNSNLNLNLNKQQQQKISNNSIEQHSSKQVTFEEQEDLFIDNSNSCQSDLLINNFEDKGENDGNGGKGISNSNNGSESLNENKDEIEIENDADNLLSSTSPSSLSTPSSSIIANKSYQATKSKLSNSNSISRDNNNNNGEINNKLINNNNNNNRFDDLSSVSSTCSSQANLVEPSHYMSYEALQGRPLENFDLIHHIDHSTTSLTINDINNSCSPTIELGPNAQNELKFGIFPKQLILISLNKQKNYLHRLEALEEMMCIIRDSPINHLAILMTYFDSFLSTFLEKLLLTNNNDYKLELIAIDMIETIVIKTKISTIQYIRPIISLLIKSMSSSRQIFRENIIRVIHKMMAFLPPQYVIDAIFEHKHNKNSLIREESINRITAAILEFDKNEFNLTKLCYHVIPMLADHSSQVRLAALECIATLAYVLGQDRIGSLLTAAEAVQTGCDYDGLLDAINARLMRRSLPRCNSDGSIKYVLKPFLNTSNANYHQEHQAADVRWILEAPSSHQHVGGGGGGGGATGSSSNKNNNNPDNDHHNRDHNHHDCGGSNACEHHLHHAHRPGAYSPPEISRDGKRRASVVDPNLLIASVVEESHHQHNHHHHGEESSDDDDIMNVKHKHHHHHHHHQQHHHHQHNPYQNDTTATTEKNNYHQTPSHDTSNSNITQHESNNNCRPNSSSPIGSPPGQLKQQKQQQQQQQNKYQGVSQDNKQAVSAAAAAGVRKDSERFSHEKQPQKDKLQHNRAEFNATSGGAVYHNCASPAAGVASSDLCQGNKNSEIQKRQKASNYEQSSIDTKNENDVVNSSVNDISNRRSSRISSNNNLYYNNNNNNNNRRSNSQDSNSTNTSTDTNKVLFQYYLEKFKQSLTGQDGNSSLMVLNKSQSFVNNNNNNINLNSALPSDAIIFTDSAQAYALSKNKSRYQQTSFDYDSDSVGRVPQNEVPQNRRKNFNIRKTSIQQQQHNASSPITTRDDHETLFKKGKRFSSPLINKDNSSGSESPITIMENLNSKKQTSIKEDENENLNNNNSSSSSRRKSVSGSMQSKQKTISKENYNVEDEELNNNNNNNNNTSRRQSQNDTKKEQELNNIRRRESMNLKNNQDEIVNDEEFEKNKSQQRQQQQRKQQRPLQRSHATIDSPPNLGAEETDAKNSINIINSNRDVRKYNYSSVQDEVVDNSNSQIDQYNKDLIKQQITLESTTSSQSILSDNNSLSNVATKTNANNNNEESDVDQKLTSSGDGGAGRRHRSSRRNSNSKRRVSRRASEISSMNTVDNQQEEIIIHNNVDPEAELELQQIRRRTSKSQPPLNRQQNKQQNQQQQQQHLIRTSSKSQMSIQTLKHNQQNDHTTNSNNNNNNNNQKRSVSVSPSLACNVNIRHILETVAEVEGPFQEPQLALKVALNALDSPCWSTKVEGILALIRLVTFNKELILNNYHLHEIIYRLTQETKNLRSTVARSAIFALGDYCLKLKKSIELELDTIVQALLLKSTENTTFIRDDIKKAFTLMVDNLTQWRLATLLIQHGATHKNLNVRKMASQFISLLVDKMGAAKCLVGARDISSLLLPATAKFAQDQSPQTRYYGRFILSKIMQHGAFDRLMRKNLTPNLYRSTIGVMESVKRRGPGEQPIEI